MKLDENLSKQYLEKWQEILRLRDWGYKTWICKYEVEKDWRYKNR